MSAAFSIAKFTAQPFPLNTTSPKSYDPLKIPPSTTSAFLGFTRKLRLASSSSSNTHRRSAAFVAVSDVVKEKKSKSVSNLLITKEEGLELYEDMVLGRAFEDMCAQMYYRGKMFGFVHLYNGQEAVLTGFIKPLKQEDYVVSTYRDHVHTLSKGVSARAVMSEFSVRPLATAGAKAGLCICSRKNTI